MSVSSESTTVGREPADKPDSVGPETETAEQEQEAAESAQEPAERPQEPSSNAEAARYRRQLREAETERDSLAQVLESVRRGQVEDLATSAAVAGQARLHDADDVWRGRELSDFLDDAGRVDPKAVREAVGELVRAKPHLGRWAGSNGDAHQGHEQPRMDGVSWSDLMRGGADR